MFLFSSKLLLLLLLLLLVEKEENKSIKLREASYSASLGVKLPFIHISRKSKIYLIKWMLSFCE